jgi:hypothetical protein
MSTSLARIATETQNQWKKRAFQWASFACVFLLFLSGREAKAGNDEGIPIGVEASLLGGAVTARVSEASAAWYNPAGIAHSNRTTVNLNVSVYGIDIRTNDALIVTSEGTRAEANFINWKLVPSAFGVVRKISPRLNVALVLFVPTTSDFMFQTQAQDKSGHYVTAASSIGSSYYAGLSAGWRLAKNLRFGTTAFGIYRWSYRSTLITANSDESTLSGSEVMSDSRYGLSLNTGFQWDMTKKITLGMSVMTPSVILASSESQTLVLDDASGHEASVVESADIDPYLFAPPKLRLGIHTLLSEEWELELETSFSSAIHPASQTTIQTGGFDDSLSRRFLYNVAVGGLYHYDENLSFGGGVFSDRNPWEQGGLNYYGFTTGFRFHKHYKMEKGQSLTIESSVGGRYAYGSGDGLTLSIDPNGTMSTAVTEGSSRVHELSLNLGSAVHF